MGNWNPFSRYFPFGSHKNLFDLFNMDFVLKKLKMFVAIVIKKMLILPMW